MSETPEGYKIENFVDADALVRDTTIHPNQLSEAMYQQPGLMAYYAERHRLAMRQEGRARMRRDAIEGKVDKELRDAAADEGKKITEAQIGKEIARDRRYQRAQLDLNEAKAIAQLAKDAIEAVKHRRDMIIQLGVNEREERKGEVRVLSQEAAESARRVSRDRAREIASGGKGSDGEASVG